MRRALVLGVNGQDGSYLAEQLLRRGYEVTGVGRQLASRHVHPSTVFRYVQIDLRQSEPLVELVGAFEPDLAFHVAAVHGSSGHSYEAQWRDMMGVNVLSLHVLLEHARTVRPSLRIVYAGSSKVFPAPWTDTLSEATPCSATCLYGIGKMASLELITHYRREHGVKATNLILFNHESPRRGATYFVPKIARALSDALAGAGRQTEFQSLDFWIDWSAADEIMGLAIDIAERAPDEDFVMASGRTWHGRQAVEAIFDAHGLDYRRHIVETAPRRDPGPSFRVSIDRLAAAIGARPLKTIHDIVADIIADIRAGAP